MNEPSPVRLERQDDVAWIWLERPEVHNAFNAAVVSGLCETIAEVAASDARALVLASRGRSFSAGADLNWMRAAGETSPEENRADAERLAQMLRTLTSMPQATIARVQGTALGGGLGLISACDVVIAVERAKFGFSEVKLGLIPAVISPHVVAKIGPGRARHLFVTGERFAAARAEQFGIVSQVVADEAALDAAVTATLAEVLANSPAAVAAAKDLVTQVTTLGVEDVDGYTAGRIAAMRASDDGKEGIAAFLEKRKPRWAV